MRTRRVWVAWVAAALAVALTLSLGAWQLRRADAKRELQAQRDAAAAAAPLLLATAADFARASERLPLRVRVRGEFSEGATVFLDNRIIDGVAGFLVVTPLRSSDGTPVLVERGWTARDPADRNRLPPVATPAGVVEIEGLAVEQLPRLLELGGAPTVTVPGIWQNLDRARYAQATGLALAPLVVQQTSDTPDGLRRARTRIDAGVDKHLGYAFQWFSLAGLIAVLALVLGWRARRRAKEPVDVG